MFSGGLKTRKIIQTSPWPFSLHFFFFLEAINLKECHELFKPARKKEFGSQKKENGWVAGLLHRMIWN